jgi:hypothetical protein
MRKTGIPQEFNNASSHAICPAGVRGKESSQS